MGRIGTVVVLAASLGLAAAEPAGAYYVWEDRELEEEVRFKGESEDCDYSEDEWRRGIPGPAKEVEVESPRDDQSLPLEDSRFASGSATASVVISASTPYDHVVTITVKARSPFCGPWESEWKTKPVEVRIKYKQRVYTTTPPVISCTDPWPSISRLRAQRATCFYANSVARRYLGRLGRATRRYIAPYTCIDTLIAEGRKVACSAPALRTAPGARYVWFRYERPAVRPPGPPARP